MSQYDPSAPPLVEETLLKRRRSLDELAHRRTLTVQQQVKRKRVLRGENIKIKRPEQYVREFRIKEGSQKKMERRKKQASKRKTVDVPKGSLKKTVGLAIRIHVGRHTSDEIKKELSALDLNAKYDAKFLKLNEETISTLKGLDAYVAYGYISISSVEGLLTRRAHTKVKGIKVPLSDNIIIEERLGKKNILCLRDMTEVIYKVGNYFEDALKILETFNLAAPNGTFEKKVLGIYDEVEDKGGFLVAEEMEDFLVKIL